MVRRMNKCLTCGGLVPASLEACPNCVVTARRLPFKPLLATVAIAASLSTYACAPYGVAPCPQGMPDCYAPPCERKLADGGDPKKDPSNTCFVDGGIDGGP